MRITTMENGQIFEELESLKEAKSFMIDNYINNKDFLNDDSSLYIEYNDGSGYYLSDCEESGTFKRTGIKTIIECNPATWTVYGNWVMTKTDDDDSNEDCVWLADTK